MCDIGSHVHLCQRASEEGEVAHLSPCDGEAVHRRGPPGAAAGGVSRGTQVSQERSEHSAYSSSGSATGRGAYLCGLHGVLPDGDIADANPAACAGADPRAVLQQLAAIQMIDVHLPVTDGRCLVMSRHTEPEPEQQLLLDKLCLRLPEQPPPKIYASELAALAPYRERSCAPKMTPLDRIDFRYRKDRKSYEKEAIQGRADGIDTTRSGCRR